MGADFSDEDASRQIAAACSDMMIHNAAAETQK